MYVMITHRPNSTCPSLPPGPCSSLKVYLITLSEFSQNTFRLPESQAQCPTSSIISLSSIGTTLSESSIEYRNRAGRAGWLLCPFVCPTKSTDPKTLESSLDTPQRPDLVYRPNLDSSQLTPVWGQSPINQTPTSCVLTQSPRRAGDTKCPGIAKYTGIDRMRFFYHGGCRERSLQ